MKKNNILKIYGTDYKEMTKRLLHEADLISDIPKKAKRIGIKPNLVTPTPASFGATTHPEIIAGIIEYLRSYKDFEIIIAEGSWVGDKTSEAFEICGYNDLAKKYDVRLFDTQNDTYHPADVLKELQSIPSNEKKEVDHLIDTDEKYRFLNINDCVSDFDYLINVPVLKGHCQTKITCALKNMKGLIPNFEKRRFHSLGLHKPIAYLNACIKQDFIIVDHICGDLDFEEGGNPVIKNCIMAAKDPVLIDAYVCKLLNYSTKDVFYVDISDNLSIGCADINKASVITISDDGTNIKNDGSSIDEEKNLRDKKILAVSYAVDEIDSCSACYGTLIPTLTKLKDEGLLDKLNLQIAIGQGHRNKSGSLGVGDCTCCFNHYIAGCPPTEDDIYKGLKEFILSMPSS